MPRPIVFTGKPAIQTVNRVRKSPSFTVESGGTTQQFDTIQEVVKAQPDQNFLVRHTYQDYYDQDGRPCNRLSFSETDLLDQLCYEKFVRPFEAPIINEEEE